MMATNPELAKLTCTAPLSIYEKSKVLSQRMAVDQDFQERNTNGTPDAAVEARGEDHTTKKSHAIITSSVVSNNYGDSNHIDVSHSVPTNGVNRDSSTSYGAHGSRQYVSSAAENVDGKNAAYLNGNDFLDKNTISHSNSSSISNTLTNDTRSPSASADVMNKWNAMNATLGNDPDTFSQAVTNTTTSVTKASKPGGKPSLSNKNSTSCVLKKLKGVKVGCGDLRQYLYSLENYRRASMLRKGREVHKVYVDVTRGTSFLDDRFALTEFGRVVLQNGCVRAGRARNVRQIVVARETLYCSGTCGCRRACGGFGMCVAGCDKVKVRGHKCSFRVKLTMRLGFVDCWFVEILGSHNHYIFSGREGRKADGGGRSQVKQGPLPSDMDKMLADYEIKSSDGEDSFYTGGLTKDIPIMDTSIPLSEPATSSVVASSNPGEIFNLLSPMYSEMGKFNLPSSEMSSDGFLPSPIPLMSPLSSMKLPVATSALSPFGSPPTSSSLLQSPLNIPLFPDPYLLAIAQNAAAAAGIAGTRVLSPPRDKSSSPSHTQQSQLKQESVSINSTLPRISTLPVGAKCPDIPDVVKPPSSPAGVKFSDKTEKTNGDASKNGVTPNMEIKFPPLLDGVKFPPLPNGFSLPTLPNGMPIPPLPEGLKFPPLPNGVNLFGNATSQDNGGGFLSPPSMLGHRYGLIPPLYGFGLPFPVPSEEVLDLSKPRSVKKEDLLDPSFPQDLSSSWKNEEGSLKSIGKTQQCSQKSTSALSQAHLKTGQRSPSRTEFVGKLQNVTSISSQSLNKPSNSVVSDLKAVDTFPLSSKVLSSHNGTFEATETTFKRTTPKKQRKNQQPRAIVANPFPVISTPPISTSQTPNNRDKRSPPAASQSQDSQVALSPTPTSHQKLQPSPFRPIQATHSTSDDRIKTLTSQPVIPGQPDKTPIKSSQNGVSMSADTKNSTSDVIDPQTETLNIASLGGVCLNLPTDKESTVGDNEESSTTAGTTPMPDKRKDKELTNRIRQLEAHVTQLRNVVLKADGTKVEGQGRSKKQQREFDFNKYNTRHVALKIAYLGWDYHGFVVQEDTDKTVEAALFDALLRTRLIESRETSNYHRCGRTDKGVSAFGQVISIDLRTNLLSGVGVKVREGGTAHTRPGDTNTEIRFVHILNKVLPPEIRVLAWAPVSAEFSARFSCKRRTYKYYFPKANLDLELMAAAAKKLIGEHDFRNLCKMDVGNGVVNFTRKILSTDIKVLDESSNGYSLCELTVVGQAFLWHQIRCIVTVLFLVAQRKEEVSVIDQLLNVEDNPRKPQYNMASELPLVLYDCEYDDDLEWVYEADWHEENIHHFQQIWAEHTVRATMLKRMLDGLERAKVETESDIAPWNELSAPLLQQSDWIIPGHRPRVYKPLFKRQMCESLEERLEHFAKRRKITTDKDGDEPETNDIAAVTASTSSSSIPSNTSTIASGVIPTSSSSSTSALAATTDEIKLS